MVERKRVEKEVEHTEPFHVKYRPTKLDQVLGQDAVVKSLRAAMRQQARPHTFLFSGPTGTGKTTLARIISAELGCLPQNIVEVDAASNSGIDAMRDVTSTLRYNGFGASPNRGIIVDECHGLSKQAWDSLLKSIEEPPPHVFFFFCTTNPEKVPATVLTRMQNYQLKAFKQNDLMDLLEYVCDQEELDCPSKFLEMAARASNGSPRQALVMLSMIHSCDDEEEAARLLEQPLEDKEIIDLCRAMVQRKLDWEMVQKTLKTIETPAESARIIITAYLSSCVMGAKTEKQAMDLLSLLRIFSKPCNPTDKIAPLLLAFDDVLFGV